MGNCAWRPIKQSSWSITRFGLCSVSCQPLHLVKICYPKSYLEPNQQVFIILYPKQAFIVHGGGCFKPMVFHNKVACKSLAIFFEYINETTSNFKHIHNVMEFTTITTRTWTLKLFTTLLHNMSFTIIAFLIEYSIILDIGHF